MMAAPRSETVRKITHRRSITVGNRIVATVVFTGAGIGDILPEVCLALLSAGECMEAAQSLRSVLPRGSITHEAAYRFLMRAGMPNGGLYACEDRPHEGQ